MALHMTITEEQNILSHSLAVAGVGRVAQCYVAFLTGPSDDNGSQTNEIGVRQTIDFNAPSNRQIVSTADIDIDTTTGWGASGTLTHTAIADASTAGNYLWTGPLNDARSFTAGDQLQIAANQFTLTIAGTNKSTVKLTELWHNHRYRQSSGGAAWTAPTSIEQSQHTAVPDELGSDEFAGGGYARQAVVFANTDRPTTSTRRRNSTATQFANIQSTPLRAWGLWTNAGDFVYMRDRGSDATVNPGSSIDYAINLMEVLAG